jgi:hypothetical protein
LTIASPAVSGLAAYFLIRRFTLRAAPAVIGGYLYGFSSFELGALTGHVHAALVFAPPLVVLLAAKRLDLELSRRRFIVLLALLFAVQLLLETELLVDCVMFGAAGLLATWLFGSGPRRERTPRLALDVLLSGTLAIAVTSPFLYYLAFKGFPRAPAPMGQLYGTDLLNFVVPTPLAWLHHDFVPLATTFEGGDFSGSLAYLSVPLLLAFALFVRSRWRSPWTRVLLAVLGVIVIASLGAHLHIAGYPTLPMPWWFVYRLPVFDYLIPSNFLLYAELLVALGIAMWLDGAVGSRRRWLLVALGIVLTFPDAASPFWRGRPENPRFFATSIYKRYLEPGERIVVLPFGGLSMSMYWQAETDMYFTMPEGYISETIPPPFRSNSVVLDLENNLPVPPQELRGFLRGHGVRRVVVSPSPDAAVWPPIFSSLGWIPQHVGGVLLYTVR